MALVAFSTSDGFRSIPNIFKSGILARARKCLPLPHPASSTAAPGFNLSS
jgi:hypothetical protein